MPFARCLPLLAAALAATDTFLERRGNLLFEGATAAAPYRFGGINAYWLGLDESSGVHPPTKFRITDALATVAGFLPNTLVRSHSIGISTGNAQSFQPSADFFNASNLDAADFAIAEAERLGLRLIVPLTDNWRYYHGGKHNFVEWCGQTDEALFYTDACAIALFKAYIAARLNHTSAYTGRRAADEPAIAMWETGNELQAPAAWVADIAAHIKSLAPRQLVLDGNAQVTADHLPLASVDVVSTHFYPPDAAKLAQGALAAAAAGKVFIAGEYGWSNSMDYNATILVCEAVGGASACAGTAAWSLFPHSDAFGFTPHGDGFTIHYPGLPTAEGLLFTRCLRAHGAAMAANASGAPLPALPPPAQPLLTAVAGAAGTAAWRGAALAAAYTVQLAPGAGGPWATVSPAGAGAPTDLDTPWSVPGLRQGAWVRVGAVGVDGAAGAWSAPAQAV